MVNLVAYSTWQELRGSAKGVGRGADIAEPAAPDDVIQVSVRLKRKNEFREKPQSGQRISHAQHDAEYGAQPVDLETVKAFAAYFNLTVADVLATQRLVLLDGKIADFEKAFHVELRLHRFPNGGHYRGRVGTIELPDEVKDAIVGVFGLDDRPVVWPAVRFGETGGAGGSQTPGPVTAFYPNELAEIYNFPLGVNGAGQKIGIVEIGGGYTEVDLNQYYNAARLGQPPTFSVRPVKGGATNTPAPLDPAKPDIEVLLDMEVAGTVAPGAELLMYFVKNGSESQILLGISAAVHDAEADLSVLSLSFGGPEYDQITGGMGPRASLESQWQENINDLFQSAGHLGVTVCVATGDGGSACVSPNDPQQQWDGKAHAGFPASSPFALACGGTHIVTPTRGHPVEEVWHPAANAGTGGGISRYFPKPDYQNCVVTQKALNPNGDFGRGVPDVSANAAQESGYRVLCDGTWHPDQVANIRPIGGTSGSTPLWAALIALLNQSLGTRLGFINPLLYRIGSPSGAFFDVTKGNNGDYAAAVGWDACTGLGSPNGTAMRDALKPLLPNPGP